MHSARIPASSGTQSHQDHDRPARGSRHHLGRDSSWRSQGHVQLSWLAMANSVRHSVPNPISGSYRYILGRGALRETGESAYKHNFLEMSQKPIAPWPDWPRDLKASASGLPAPCRPIPSLSLAGRRDINVACLAGPVIGISQSLGAKAQGCSLDPAPLEQAVDEVVSHSDTNINLVIIPLIADDLKQG